MLSSPEKEISSESDIAPVFSGNFSQLLADLPIHS